MLALLVSICNKLVSVFLFLSFYLSLSLSFSLPLSLSFSLALAFALAPDSGAGGLFLSCHPGCLVQI